MWRGILFFVKLGVLVAVAVWLAERPGRVAIDWLGYRIETSVGLLLLAALLLAVLLYLVFRGYAVVRHAPKTIGDSLSGSRRERGYKALTHGMVAVAAGDAREAERWTKKARSLLDELPLTRLLAAQTAQLNGDGTAAKRYFTEMLESEETRFLGLRGLLMQAMREGDEAAARAYLEEARKLRPNTPWVLESLIEASEKAGDLDAAEQAVREAMRLKALPRDQAKRKRALLLVERADKALAEGRQADALSDLREARRLAPELLPATLRYVRRLSEAGQKRKARALIESAWAQTPHPELAAAYAELEPNERPIDRLRRLEKLVAANGDHPESRLALARAALDAGLWGESRRWLAPLAEAAQPEQRACALMAELEEGEKADRAAAARWWRRAESASPPPAWVCQSCGAAAERWTPHCGACDAFDTLTWRQPTRIVVESAAGDPPSAAAAKAGGPATTVTAETRRPSA